MPQEPRPLATLAGATLSLLMEHAKERASRLSALSPDAQGEPLYNGAHSVCLAWNPLEAAWEARASWSNGTFIDTVSHASMYFVVKQLIEMLDEAYKKAAVVTAVSRAEALIDPTEPLLLHDDPAHSQPGTVIFPNVEKLKRDLSDFLTAQTLVIISMQYEPNYLVVRMEHEGNSNTRARVEREIKGMAARTAVGARVIWVPKVPCLAQDGPYGPATIGLRDEEHGRTTIFPNFTQLTGDVREVCRARDLSIRSITISNGMMTVGVVDDLDDANAKRAFERRVEFLADNCAAQVQVVWVPMPVAETAGTGHSPPESRDSGLYGGP